MYALINNTIYNDIHDISYDDCGCVEFLNGSSPYKIRTLAEAATFSSSREHLESIIAENNRRLSIDSERIKNNSLEVARSRNIEYDEFQLSVLDLMCHEVACYEEYDHIDPEEVISTSEGTRRYLKFNSSLLDAYLDYVH